MDITKEFLDPSILDEGYQIGILLYFHELLSNAKENVIEQSRNQQMLPQFSEIMQQLF